MSPKIPKDPIPERLFLLDGMALAYRAYFSFISRPLINSRGENTSAIFGFVNTLMKILNEEKPEHIAVVFDTKEPTFRHSMYQPYKATRQKMPEDMAGQIDRLKEVVQAFSVPCIEFNGYEADDIIGTLARKAEKENIETYLVTGDKDFMQLVSPLVKMYRPGKRGDDWEIVGEDGVMEKFGVPPGRVTDVLGLIGDKSDNVPGVRGIGEKSAIPLVQQFGSIEDILKNIEKIPQKGIKEKLKEFQSDALLSKKLVTIDTSVPIAVDLHHLVAKPRDTERLMRLFAELEFKSLLRKLMPAAIPESDDIEFDVSKIELIDITTDSHAYHLVTTESDLDILGETLSAATLISIDTETTDRDALQSQLLGLAFAITPREAWYVPVHVSDGASHPGSHPPDTENLGTEPLVLGDVSSPKKRGRRKEKEGKSAEGVPEPLPVPHAAVAERVGLPVELVLNRLSPILSNPSIKKIGQNIKYDMLVLASHGVRLEGVHFDTMVASYVLRPDGQHNLDALAAEHLRYKTITYDELTGTGRNRKELRHIDIAKVAEYSAQDADITLRLSEVLRGKLEEHQLLQLCEDIEFPLIPVLADMELTGVSLDVEFLHDLSKEMERVLDGLTRNIHTLCGEEFNINSTQQLSRILFEKLQLATVRKTKTGFSTDAFVLEELRGKHPVIEQLLEYRQIKKLKSTYIDALPDLINPRTGRVHTSFNQAIVSTGRLSSSNPNFQNIPIRTELGGSIRKAFVPGTSKNRILSADYSQIELRIMAHVSADDGLRKAFLNGEDIHATTAATIYSVPLKEVTRDMRSRMKAVNYGIMYGIGPYGLATRLGVSQTEAKELITKYFLRFPKVNQYIEDTLSKARRDGYVSTLHGRRRYFPDINSRNFNVRSNAERQAINMPIQGTAADMIKRAMIGIHQGLKEERVEAKMLLQVHDELVFEINPSDEWRARSLIVEKMKSALPLSVPIEVEVGIGEHWLAAH